jgi:prepilin-type N-terminal cleavage/methylation domain-containing protein
MNTFSCNTGKEENCSTHLQIESGFTLIEFMVSLALACWLWAPSEIVHPGHGRDLRGLAARGDAAGSARRL